MIIYSKQIMILLALNCSLYKKIWIKNSLNRDFMLIAIQIYEQLFQNRSDETQTLVFCLLIREHFPPIYPLLCIIYLNKCFKIHCNLSYFLTYF